MPILVTGATGAVGRHVATALEAGGHAVRALSRSPQRAHLPGGIDVLGGDLTDVSSLPVGLFDAVSAVFVFPADGGVDGFLDAAVAAGVGRFVVLSSLAAAAEFPRDIGSASYTHHLAVERAVSTRTEDWTILRPGTFSNNLLSWAWTIKAGNAVRAPFIHSAQAPVHEADVADAAVAVLSHDGHAGEIHALTGPQSLTRIEQVAAISAGIGRPVELVEISPEEFRADVGGFMPASIITMLLDYWADTVNTPDRVRPGVQQLTGRPGRALEKWAHDHRTDFGAP